MASKKTHVLHVRMDEKTKKLAYERASELGLDLAPFIRMLILQYNNEKKGSN